MQRELAGPDVLFRTTRLDQALGQLCAFAHGHHPAGNVAAEHIEDHVEIEVGPLGRPQQFGDVPTPELVWCGGQQFRLLVRRMRELIAALAGLAFLFEQAIHGADGAEILSFIEQRRINSGWRAILEAFAMQMCQDRCAFRWSKSAWRARPRPPDCGVDQRIFLAIVRSTRCKQRTASSARAHGGGQFGDRGHQEFSSGSGSRIGRPNSAATFFWTSMMMCALRRSSARRAFWRRSFWTSSSIGLRLDFGPRFCGVSASRMPVARSRRQVASSDEYKPSRRRRAPIPPRLSATASASCRMRSLYSAVKVRRFALAATSGSGREPSTGSAPALAGAALRCGSLRSPPLRSAPAKAPEERTPREILFISSFFFLALLIN